MPVNIDVLSSEIKRHRKIAGLSQKSLAEMAGVGKTVVFDLEKGKQTVKMETILKVLAVLNLKLQLRSPLADQKIIDL